MPINIKVNIKIMAIISVTKKIIKIPPKLDIPNYIMNWKKGVNFQRKINTLLDMEHKWNLKKITSQLLICFAIDLIAITRT